MTKPIKFDESGDNEDLQALFDSIAAGSNVVKTVFAQEPQPADTSGDSPELQALFDSIVAQVREAAPVSRVERSAPSVSNVPNAPNAPNVPSSISSEGSRRVFDKLGKITRELHDALRELGHDTASGNAARAVPDVRQHPSQIILMAEQVAGRVHNATGIAKPAQEVLQNQSQALGARWDKVFDNQISPAEFKALAADTHAFLRAMPKQIDTTNQQLMEIILLQDTQRLMAQVIRKAVELSLSMAPQLLGVLVDAIPEKMRTEIPGGLLNGQAISQPQVDDLLERLGF